MPNLLHLALLYGGTRGGRFCDTVADACVLVGPKYNHDYPAVL